MIANRGIVGVAGALLLLVSLAACSSKGGDTTCAEYKEMTGSEQSEVIRALLEEDGGTASGINVTLAKGSATLFCATVGSDSSRIREING